MQRAVRAQDLTLRVTAGAGYDKAGHVEVPVNQADTVRISSPLADVELNVRVRSFAGLPRTSPADSPYFAKEPHATNGDQYSICFRFTPKLPQMPQTPQMPQIPGPSDNDDDDDRRDRRGIPAADLQFGNTFDRPVRDRLPAGFGAAMRIAKWAIDPGMDGDLYADEPYLYGPALSSFNVVHAGPAGWEPAKGGIWADEGGDEDGRARRAAAGMPDVGSQRMRWALADANRDRWTWEFGRTYALDFFNSYLDFGKLVLRLPGGYNFSLMNFWDGQPLRYVLRNRASGDVYLVVVFSLHPPEDFDEDGKLLAEAANGEATSGGEARRGGGSRETGREAVEGGQGAGTVGQAVMGVGAKTEDDDVD